MGTALWLISPIEPCHHVCLICLHHGSNHFSVNPIGDLDFRGYVRQTNNLCISGESKVVTGCQEKLPMENKPIFGEVRFGLCAAVGNLGIIVGPLAP